MGCWFFLFGVQFQFYLDQVLYGFCKVYSVYGYIYSVGESKNEVDGVFQFWVKILGDEEVGVIYWGQSQEL